MMYARGAARVLYRKLLGLYPRAFRERFGESMEQTFNDLCNERKRLAGRGRPGFVLWLFIETAMGILREHVLLMTLGGSVRSTLANLRSPGIIGLVLMLPFALLELVHNKVSSRDAPGLAVLFGLLWILPVAFIAIVMPIARSVRTGDRVLARPIHLMLRLASLVFIAWAWAAMFIDQRPCFLGVPNCD